MNWWQILLFPFAIIYDIITRIRNLLFDIGVLKSYKSTPFKVISVGNLSVGGTGKTPMVEFLTEWALEKKISVAIVSRGYGRKTKGLVKAHSESTARDIGDEPFGYSEKFGDQIHVVVAEKRVEAMRFLENEHRDIELVILDDAYQHRYVERDINILLTTHQRPFWKDYVLPSGLLRESRRGHLRADHLVVTKCPENISVRFRSSDEKSVAYSYVNYGKPVLMNGEMKKHVVGVAGLADNRPFFDFLDNKFQLESSYSFKDHHDFKESDISQFISEARDRVILCTAKDAVKLRAFDQMKEINWGYVPIEVGFREGEQEFLKKLEAAIV